MDRFVLLLIVVIGGITGLVLYQIFLSEEQTSNTSCLPKDISQMKLEFPVRTPSALPDGYSLQGIELRNPAPTSITLYYADHFMCIHPFSDFESSQLHITVQKELNIEGHAVYSPNDTKQIIGYNETKLPSMTSLEFQQEWLKSHNQTNGITKWNVVNINSYNGVAGMETNGVTDIMFLNDSDQTLYGIGGTLPLNQLLVVARSIS